MVVHHADRLHVRIHDGRTDEAESAVLEILAERVGFGGGRRNLPHRLPSIQTGPSIDEPPAISVETSELVLDREKRPRVAHSGFDLHPVSNDRRIRSELLNSLLRVSRHLPGIELAEGAAITFPFFEHDRPAEPG